MRSLIAFVFAACLLPALVWAETTHRVQFGVGPLAVVWTPETGAPETLASAAGAVPGQPVRLVFPSELGLDKGLTGQDGGRLSPDADVPSATFYVASNAGFSIDVELLSELDPSQALASKWVFELSLESHDPADPRIGRKVRGSSADDHVVSVPVSGRGQRLTVFESNRATAAERGTIAEQSLRVQTRLVLVSGDVSERRLAGLPGYAVIVRAK